MLRECSLREMVEFLVKRKVPPEVVGGVLAEFGNGTGLSIEGFRTPDDRRFFVVDGRGGPPSYVLVYPACRARYYEHHTVPPDAFCRGGVVADFGASVGLRGALVDGGYLSPRFTIRCAGDAFVAGVVGGASSAVIKAGWSFVLQAPNCEILREDEFSKQVPHYCVLGPTWYRLLVRLEIDPTYDLPVVGFGEGGLTFNFLRDVKRIAGVCRVGGRSTVEITLDDGVVYYLDRAEAAGKYALVKEGTWKATHERKCQQPAEAGGPFYGDALEPYSRPIHRPHRRRPSEWTG